MNNYSQHLSQQPIFQKIADTVQQLGIETYVIGGYVRDHLLGRRRKFKDIDCVCVGSGIDVARAVAQAIDPAIEVVYFKNFGTAMFKWKGIEVEFVGARRESYQRDSRKPIVEDGTLEDDQNRRDFTINALAFSLNKDDFGDLVDPFDGEADLKRKLIRTPLAPDITFSDDPLRMMRAIRFATQLQFDIFPDTFDAIKANKERIKIVSQERITDELNKIILADKPSYGFKLLFHSGLLELIFPEMVDLYGVEERNGKKHKDNFYHTLQVLDNLSEVSDDLWHRWAAILHDIAKPATKRFHHKAGWTFHGHEDKGARMVPKIFKKLKLPLDQPMKFVQKLVRLHLRPIPLVKDHITDSALRRLLFDAGDDLEALMALCRADITSKDHNRVQRYLKNFDIVEQKLIEVEARDQVRNFQPVITGDIIMQTFGLKPCKQIGLIKNEVREAILDGKIPNEFDQAFGYMVSIAEKHGLQKVG